MTFAEFWDLTPADVLLAVAAHERRERADYWRAGLITATLINVNRRKGARAAKPEDFVPNPRRRTQQTAAQMAAMLKAATIAMGGTVSHGH